MNAVLFLYRTRSYLPVVDEAEWALLGVVSTWDVLGRIAGADLTRPVRIKPPQG